MTFIYCIPDSILKAFNIFVLGLECNRAKHDIGNGRFCSFSLCIVAGARGAAYYLAKTWMETGVGDYVDPH